MADEIRKPTRAEVAALLKGWSALEAARGRSRIKIEREALAQLKAAVRLHVNHAADKLEGFRGNSRMARMVAMSTIHHTTGVLRSAVASTIVDSRTLAREASRTRTAAEFSHLRQLLERDGYADDELPGDPEPADRGHDPVAAENTAASFSSRWGASALAGVLRWQDNPDTSLAHAVRQTAGAAAPRLETIANTEVSYAFVEEHLDALEPLSEYDWAPQVFKVWSALLDGRVCQRCFECDGQAVPVDDPWKDGAEMPMHPRCRCMAVPIYIPKPKALQDVAIDYAAYKAEMRDLIREGRARPETADGRHAASFLARSRLPRSPVVISRDFVTGRLAR